MDSNNQASYIFVPFSMNRREELEGLLSSRPFAEKWEHRSVPSRYFLKYIADKTDENLPNCGCFHFRLKAEVLTALTRGNANSQQGSGENLWETRMFSFPGDLAEKPGAKRDNTFRFRIREVLLYCFTSCVSILAFRVEFGFSEPMQISNALFHLKRVSTQMIYPVSQKSQKTTFLNLSRMLLADGVEDEQRLSFFEYSVPQEERANVLTYVDVPSFASVRKELFYLRHCYSGSYEYSTDIPENPEEVYYASQNTVWGVTSEAVVCMVCSSESKGSFLKDQFFRNFNSHYLFMTVWLLHQKYVLYMLLTGIGRCESQDLSSLERYREQLYVFQTDFVFTHITEVPQYQILYNRIYKAFSLEELFVDVQEPLIRLRDLRQSAAELEQKRSGISKNALLFYISVFSFLSIVHDDWGDIAQLAQYPLGLPLMLVVLFVLIAVPFWDWLKLKPMHRNSRNNKKPLWSPAQQERGLAMTNEPGSEKDFIYIGCFTDYDALWKKLGKLPAKPLKNKIETPHVTVLFRPEKVDRALFGEEVRIIVDGYGNDGRNEGVHVQVVSKNDALQVLLDRVVQPHITLSIAPGEQSKNTKYLNFRPLEKTVELEGTFGGFRNGAVILEKE